MNVKKIKLKTLAAAILIPLAVGGLAAFLTKDAMQSFDRLYKPLLSPPAWLFPAVWTVLYILMGIASYLICVSDASAPRKKRALTVYAVQLAANFLWSIFFFALGAYFFSFLWLLLLAALIAGTMVMFCCIDKTAERLLIPYIIWVSFAGYLNLGIFLLN